MKCIKHPQGEIKRVTDQEAKTYIAYGWRYCSKTEWKAYNAKLRGKS